MLIVATPAVFAPAVPVQSQPPPRPIHHDTTPSALLSFSCSVLGLMHVCLSQLDPRWLYCHANGGACRTVIRSASVLGLQLTRLHEHAAIPKGWACRAACTQGCDISSRPSMPRWQGIILIYVCLCSSCTNPNASELASHPARGRCL